MTAFFLLAVAAYLAGSVNFSIILFALSGKSDPRDGHSGNPGATNVYRQAGWFWALVVLLLDAGRAMAIAYAATALLSLNLVPLVGLALIVGNHWPCFHGFKGGKGVANYLGFTAVIAPIWAGAAVIGWLLSFAALRTPFIGSFVMVILLAAGTLLKCGLNLPAVLGVSVTVGLIGYCHRLNVNEFRNRYRRGPG